MCKRKFTGEGRRLTEAEVGSDTVSYTYNIDGIRTSKTVGTETTEYFLEGSAVIAQKTGDDVLWFLYDADGQRIGFTYNDTPYLYVYNAAGDVVGIVDDTLTMVVEYTYSPWGEILSTTGDEADTIGIINPFRYRGYYYDEETGLYYLNARYYDPETGRFINADSIIAVGTDIATYNMFAYCKNNPIIYSDTDGQWAGLDDLIAGAVGAVAGLASQFVADIATSVMSGSWQFSNWQSYVGSAVGGALGGITTLYAGPIAGAAVGGGASTLIGQTLENLTGAGNYSTGEIIINSAIDATFSAGIAKILPVKVSTITSGRNSMSAVFASGLTKIKNGTAGRMSLKVIRKGIISETVSSLWDSGVSGVKNYITNQYENATQSTQMPEGPLYWCNP